MGEQKQIQKQQQKLAPQQVLAMKLLHLPLQELLQTINEEVEKNPLLEVESEPMESLNELDSGASDDYEDLDSRDFPTVYHASRDDWQPAEVKTFAENLYEQFALKPLSNEELETGHEIIGDLDDSGYLTRDVGIIANDLALYHDLEVTPAEVERVLGIVQSLEPAGVGARSLQECLALQLHRIAEPTDEERLATEIVDRCFESFAQRRYEEIGATLGVEEERLAGAVAVIQRLNPKPGGAVEPMAGDGIQVIPDLVVYRQGENVGFYVNDSQMPKLGLNEEYMAMLQEMTKGKGSKDEAAKYIESNAESATVFMEALKERSRTMAAVMKEIVRQQKKYFLSGEAKDLKPMMQKTVAEAVGIDESAMSRMVNSKFVETPYGMIRLKELFTTGVVSESGESVSIERVKELLRQAVEEEDPKNPLSDQELADLLKENGFPTARRTVAKYREQMGIAVGKLRRGLKVVAIAVALGGLTLGAMAQRPPSQKAAAEKKTTEKTEEKAEEKKAERDPEVLPSMLWYGKNFSDSRVRLRDMPLDSLPDEINLNLLKKGEQFVFPVKNPRTSPYGWRWERAHRGVDIGLRTGEPIHCAFDGMVRIAKPMGGYGNLVVVRHYNGLETVYGHMSKINVKPHQVVKAGDVLGLGGSTGHSTGPHLHFEVRFQYETFDPEWLIDFSNYTLRTKRLHLDKSYFGIKKPRGRKGEVLEYKADKSYIKESDRKKAREMYHVVKAGEVLADIAHRYSTTVEKIKELNEGLSKKPKAGTRIRVR